MTNLKRSILGAFTTVFVLSCSSTPQESAKTLQANSLAWPAANVSFCSAQLDKATKQLDGFRKAYLNPKEIPTSFVDGEVKYTTPMGWTSGFVAGNFWYIYEHTQDPSWLDTAKTWTYALEDMRYNRRTHDIGFIMYNSYGNGLRLTGNEDYNPILVDAAKTLMERYNPTIGATYSWSFGSWEFPVIIDNMMNLELLFHASKVSGDSIYYDAAVSHSKVTMKHHYRDDYSSYHLVNYDRETGVPHFKQTVQGIADDSSWARGQSWGAYGYTMVYRSTQDPIFLEQATNIADYLLSHPNMPSDLVPYFDYNAPDDPAIPNHRDASAASLLASNLLELSNYVKEEKAQKYRDAAMTILRSLSTSDYFSEKGENGHFILKQSVGHFPAGREINSALNYADYYYLEALTRCKQM